MAERLQKAAVSRFQLHISTYGAAAHARKLPAHLRAGENQRGVRIGQDQRAEILRVPQPPVRHRLHKCDAHQPVWPKRQLPPRTQPCAAGPDTPFPRGQGAGAQHRNLLGRRQSAARIPLR